MIEMPDNFPAISDLFRAILAIVCGAIGTYLLLPHPHGRIKARNVHILGVGLTALGLVLLASFWNAPASLISGFFFYLFGLSALGGAVLTVTSRNPVYSALWFAAVVLSTAGLFLLAGAQFLAAGTIIVYAGAIIVTFLFVIMLAQMEGKARYDRSSRSPAAATFTSYLLLWSLVFAVLCLRVPVGGVSPATNQASLANRLRPTTYLLDIYGGQMGSRSINSVLRESVRPTALLDPRKDRSKVADADPTIPHVAGLGATMFTDHLITVELSGILLFVALVGAIAIAQPKKPIRPTIATPSA